MSSETIEKDSKRKVRASEKEPKARDEEERDEDEREEEDERDDGDRDSGAGESDESDDDAAEASAPTATHEPIDRPSSLGMIGTIARRELMAYLHSPITYIVGCVSFLVFGLWFFFYKGGFWQVDRATMTRMFDTVPGALCIIIPLFTMRTLSDEKRIGTIELLITMPVKDSEVILGKYIAALAMVLLQVGMLALYPIAMFKGWHIGELDWGAFWVGMLGLFFLSAAGTAIGLMWSSFTENQIVSFFLGAITLGGLYFLGLLTLVESLQGWPGEAISFISLQTRFDSFGRGIIDTRAIVYFVSLTVLALFIAFRSLESRKWA